jgi:hypothetical protein
MDLEMITRICPIEALTACREDGRQVSWEDNRFMEMLTGIFLQIDNAAFDACVAAVDKRVMEVCGDTISCDSQFADPTFGVGGLSMGSVTSVSGRPNEYTVTISGVVDFRRAFILDGRVNADGTTKSASEPDLELPRISPSYLAGIAVEQENHRSAIRPDVSGATVSERTFQGVVQRINTVINSIASDPGVQACIGGRDLSQITGAEATATARFPRMLDDIALMVISTGLNVAERNHNREIAKLREEARKSLLDSQSAN